MSAFFTMFGQAVAYVISTLSLFSQKSGVPILSIVFGWLFIRLLLTIININVGGDNDAG